MTPLPALRPTAIPARRRRVAIVGLLAVAALLGGPAAQAAQPADPAQAAAIAAALERPAGCLEVAVSTVDPTWASAGPSGADAAGGEPCDAEGPPLQVLRLAADGGWAVHREITSQDVACQRLAIPDAVGVDLATCVPQRTGILCQPADPLPEFRRALRSHPRSCATIGPRTSFAESPTLARLRWSGWGRATATARGVVSGRRGAPDVPTRVRASRLRVDCEGHRVYTRLRVTTRYGRDTLRFPADCSG